MRPNELLRHLRPHGYEVAAWGGLAAAVIFLRAHGLRIDGNTVSYTLRPLVPVVLQAMAVGAVMHALWRLLEGGRSGLRDYLRAAARPVWLLDTLRITLASLLFTYAYVWLKVSVPLVRDTLLDPLLWRLDALLHLGFSPNVFWIEALRGTGLLGPLDFWYATWLTTVVYGYGFFATHADRRARSRFVLSATLTWILGAWIYVAVPAVGPCYAFPELVAPAREEMPRAAGAQEMLWQNYRRMVAGRAGTLRSFNPTRGVAALPSLHVGLHWLLALWSRRLVRPLFLPFLVATLFTFMGSVASGWHYALDGWAGILLAQGCYLVAVWRWQGPVRDPR